MKTFSLSGVHVSSTLPPSGTTWRVFRSTVESNPPTPQLWFHVSSSAKLVRHVVSGSLVRARNSDRSPTRPTSRELVSSILDEEARGGSVGNVSASVAARSRSAKVSGGRSAVVKHPLSEAAPAAAMAVMARVRAVTLAMLRGRLVQVTRSA